MIVTMKKKQQQQKKKKAKKDKTIAFLGALFFLKIDFSKLISGGRITNK